MPEIYLNAIASALGGGVEPNDTATLGQSPEDCERIVKKTGVLSRPVALPDQYTSDLACTAARKLLHEANISASEINSLLVCTQTPDHLIPGVSSRVHGQLRFPQNCFVLDINQGCSGFILGTQTVAALLRSRAGSAILINADTYSRLIRPDDLTTRILFGDAAAASLFSTQPRGLRVLYNNSFADGSGYDAFVARGSALRREQHSLEGIHMDGPGILNFALQAVPDAINRAIKDTGLELSTFRMIAFHQANSFVIGKLVQKLRLRTEQVPQNCSTLGNTVSASIPLLLLDHWVELKPGELVLAVGFGVGLSWGVSIFERVDDAP